MTDTQNSLCIFTDKIKKKFLKIKRQTKDDAFLNTIPGFVLGLSKLPLHSYVDGKLGRAGPPRKPREGDSGLD